MSQQYLLWIIIINSHIYNEEQILYNLYSKYISLRRLHFSGFAILLAHLKKVHLSVRHNFWSGKGILPRSLHNVLVENPRWLLSGYRNTQRWIHYPLHPLPFLLL